MWCRVAGRMARVQAPGTTQNTASMLRTFLTWLYAEGLTATSLAGTVPGAYRRRRIRMPALVTGAEAAALLAACDRATAQGLRDYAIVLILTRMGLRAREIAALTLEDVDWRSGIVEISGKGGRRDQLPLPRDVAGAVIAYLRDGRTAAALDRALFVRSVAPHRGLTGYAVGHSVARAARRAGLDRVRPHQLRYLAATAMQAAGAPLAEIGQVLRHEDERTTSLYAKVDVAALRPLAPPWPAAPSVPGFGWRAVNPPARTLAGHLDDYLTLRRALGCKLIRAERYLRQFLDYLGERELDTLTVEAAADWVSQSRHGSAAPGLGMEAVRGFAVFLHAHDPAHEVPPPGLFPRRRLRAVPYLYSPADIATLQAAAGRLRGPLRAETYTTLIALLAVTGLRIGEALALDDDDIDTGEGMLIVRQDKAQSFRLVPLHPTALAAVAGYRRRRDQAFPGRAVTAVLVSRTGDRLTYNAVHKTFTRLAAAAGLGPRTGRCRPTIHGLRHSFAVSMLAGWYRDGADVPARLPWLSTVMGHSGPASTYWYVSSSPELMALAAQRLQDHVDRAGGASRAGQS